MKSATSYRSVAPVKGSPQQEAAMGMKLGTEVANVHSWMMVGNHKGLDDKNISVLPQVGDGATVILWTDRYAGTIVKVTPAQIHVQRDKAVREGKVEMSDCQQYTYEPDAEGAVYVFRKTKRGYRCGSFGLAIGIRDEHYDYGF